MKNAPAVAFQPKKPLEIVRDRLDRVPERAKQALSKSRATGGFAYRDYSSDGFR